MKIVIKLPGDSICDPDESEMESMAFGRIVPTRYLIVEKAAIRQLKVERQVCVTVYKIISRKGGARRSWNVIETRIRADRVHEFTSPLSAVTAALGPRNVEVPLVGILSHH